MEYSWAPRSSDEEPSEALRGDWASGWVVNIGLEVLVQMFMSVYVCACACACLHLL